jgi:hypothetical protein
MGGVEARVDQKLPLRVGTARGQDDRAVQLARQLLEWPARPALRKAREGADGTGSERETSCPLEKDPAIDVATLYGGPCAYVSSVPVARTRTLKWPEWHFAFAWSRRSRGRNLTM